MTQKNKILISCSAARSLTQFRGKLIEELMKTNSVYVFTPEIPDEKIRKFLDQAGVIVFENSLIRNNISILSDIKYIIQLAKVILKIKPDVFFAYTFKPLIFGCIVAYVLGVKSKVAMLTGLGYSFANTKKSYSKSVIHRLLKFSLRLDRKLKIIFQNEDDREELIKKNIIDYHSETYIVNGSGVDLGYYPYLEPNISPVKFLMISRLIKAKGVEEFFEAVKIIHRKYPEVKFSIVGSYIDHQIDSVDYQFYKEIISSEFIEYTGWVDDVRPYIRDSSVVILASYREGTPRSILEGMAMGRPVITTDTAGCRQTVSPDPKHKNGILIKTRSVSEIVSSMEFFILNPDRIVPYGINGRAYAEEKYDVRKVNQEMLKILIPNANHALCHDHV